MRRELSYENLDGLVAELKTFQGKEVETFGTWSLHQICEHLSDAFVWAMSEDVQFTPPETKPLPPKVARRFYDKMIKSGKMPDGIDNPMAPKEYKEGEPDVAIQRLLDVVATLKSHSEPFINHPLLGELTSDEWRAWGCIHAAHHMSYVSLKS